MRPIDKAVVILGGLNVLTVLALFAYRLFW